MNCKQFQASQAKNGVVLKLPEGLNIVESKQGAAQRAAVEDPTMLKGYEDILSVRQPQHNPWPPLTPDPCLILTWTNISSTLVTSSIASVNAHGECIIVSCGAII